MTKKEILKIVIAALGLLIVMGLTVSHNRAKRQEIKTGYEERTVQPGVRRGEN